MSRTEQQTGRNSRDSTSTPARRLQPADSGSGSRKNTEPANVPPGKTWLWFVFILVANFLLGRLLIPTPEAPITVPYTLFKQEVGKKTSRRSTVKGTPLRADSQLQSYISRWEKRTPGSGGETKTKNEKNSIPGGEIKSTDDRGRSTGSLSQTISVFMTTLPAFVDSGLEQFLISNGSRLVRNQFKKVRTPGRRSF
ncbi:MAG: hypothetical protein IPK92_14810 [Nitrospira sp.]|nr:hypothetical protein [Nitrospira sp.]